MSFIISYLTKYNTEMPLSFPIFSSEMFKKVLEFAMTPAGIDTAKLYPILMSSGLPREALGQIWASANRTTPGMLTKEELYTVLALIGVAQVNIKVGTNHPLRITSLIIH